MRNGARIWMAAAGIGLLLVVTMSSNCICPDPCEDCPGLQPVPGPGPLIVTQPKTTDPNTLQFYDQDNGAALTLLAAGETQISQDLVGTSVNTLECKRKSDGNWMGVDEVKASDGSHEMRLKKTSIGLFWYRKPSGGNEQVLEPTSDTAYANKVPSEFGSLTSSTLEGDGVPCDEVRLQVITP